jgi:hypothetical protein
MSAIVNVALFLAVVAIVPSAGPFTPAILISGLTALIALFAVSRGYFRRGILTIYFALSAAIVSPAFIDIAGLEFWIIALHVLGGISALVLYWDFNRRQSDAVKG